MSDQDQIRTLAQEQAERVVQRLMKRYTADTRCDAPSSAQDPAFRHWLGLASGMLQADLTRADVAQIDARLIPVDVARQRLCVALLTEDHAVALVLADPFDRAHRLWLEARLRAAGHPRSRWYVTPVQALLSYLDRVEQAREIDLSVEALPATHIETGSPTAPARPVIEDLMRQALDALATHVHLFQNCRDGNDGMGSMSLRVDGVLRRVPGAPDAGTMARVFDYLADAAQQDGVLTVTHDGRDAVARIALLPVDRPTSAVLHLPVPAHCPADAGLDDLGHEAEVIQAMHRALARSSGLWLIAGPPGGGKTATMAALARTAAAVPLRTVSLARPGSALLRETLDQDPDRILIDEIDDRSCAACVADLVLSGRSVTLSVSSTEPWSALQRLHHLGLPPAVLGAGVRGLLMQNLVRLACPFCSRPHPPGEQLLRESQLPVAAGQWTFIRGEGCEHCHGTGHLGRQVISRWLPVGAGLKALIQAQAPQAVFLAAAEREGYAGLRQAALELVSGGLVSLEEANRVAAVAL